MILLPNMRWLALPSAFSGEDWREVSHRIDEALYSGGYDLAEESVYLLYDSDPEAILRGEGRCKVARSVIGPKKNPEAPLELLDWKSASVFKKQLTAQVWDEAFKEATHLWKATPKDYKVFILRVNRQLRPQLSLLVEAIFAE